MKEEEKIQLGSSSDKATECKKKFGGWQKKINSTYRLLQLG